MQQCTICFYFEHYIIVLLYLHHVQDLVSPPLTNDDIELASKSLLEKTCQGQSLFDDLLLFYILSNRI